LKKLSLNICVGESGDRLTRASKILEELTGQKPSVGRAERTVRSFGIQRNEEISVFCTVRGSLASDLLERALRIKEYRLPSKSFTDDGTFAFGIEEHIDLEGMKYDPKIGIFGMNFVVVCGKPGINNRVTREEAIAWFQTACSGVATNTDK
jgi:large subunit ribosomal protein L11e